MKDWLGNDIEVGDLVLYTSKSSNTGMVLGTLTEVTHNRIQLKPIATSARMWTTKVITLHRENQAFNSVTKYRGAVEIG